MSQMSKRGPEPKVTDSELIDAIKEIGDRVVTSREIADIVDMTREHTQDRLFDLADEGAVEYKEIGGGRKVWWV